MQLCSELDLFTDLAEKCLSGFFSFAGMFFLCISRLICVSVQLCDCCSDLGRRHKVARVEQSFC